jgi:tetratricopeptide (TPR) repeat protein
VYLFRESVVPRALLCDNRLPKEGTELDHPSRDELAVLSWGSLPAKRERKVLRHLLVARCPECLAALPPRLAALLGLERWRRPRDSEESARDTVTTAKPRAKPLDLERHLREQRAAADRGLKALAAGRELPRRMAPLARLWALLDRSWQLRYDDPQEMVFLAWTAAAVSLELDRGLYGRKRVCDFQAKAEADLGNACRVANRPDDAERALWRARQLFEQGTGDPLLEVRLLDFEASMLGARRRWVPASQKLLKLLVFYQERDDAHLIGRTLVNVGLYAGYEGRYEVAIERLEQSLKLIDAEREPYAAYCAAHNLILFLVESGRITEAKKFRLLLSRHLLRREGRIAQIRFRVLEGHIAASEGSHGKAEGILREVVDDFEQVGLPIFAGIEMLSLTVVLLRQGKAAEAEATVVKAAEIFSVHRFEREALQAVILLRDAFRMKNATLQMVLEVSEFVRRVLYDPALRFEARAWEEGP